MINLEEKIGLPVLLHDDNRLEFEEGIEHDQMSVRKFSDLAPVVADEGAELSDKPAYIMYRNARKSSEGRKIAEMNLRFDLTVIPAARIGNEFVKTFGHNHPKKRETQIAYPEAYFVIVGEIRFLIQNVERNDAISFVLPEGGSTIIPPGYGHVMINESDKVIVVADWTSNAFESDYNEFEDKRGASYYYKTNKEFEKNSNYADMGEIRELNNVASNILEGMLPYGCLNEVEKLDFLNDPEDHQKELDIDKLFIS